MHQFLLDTGASISSLPYNMVSNMTLHPSNVTCSAANGSPIKCHGEVVANISIPKLRREFTWTFIVAEITMPIIGMDFLHNFGLLIDCGQRTLQDTYTTLLAPLKITSEEVPSLHAQLQGENTDITSLLQDFPSLISPIDINNLVIKNNGPKHYICLLYTSDAADERSSVDLG